MKIFPKIVTGRLKTGHLGALQNQPLQGVLFISVFLAQASGFSISSFHFPVEGLRRMPRYGLPPAATAYFHILCEITPIGN
jgi:hypothetical protein